MDISFVLLPLFEDAPANWLILQAQVITNSGHDDMIVRLLSVPYI